MAIISAAAEAISSSASCWIRKTIRKFFQNLVPLTIPSASPRALSLGVGVTTSIYWGSIKAIWRAPDALVLAVDVETTTAPTGLATSKQIALVVYFQSEWDQELNAPNYFTETWGAQAAAVWSAWVPEASNASKTGRRSKAGCALKLRDGVLQVVLAAQHWERIQQIFF